MTQLGGSVENMFHASGIISIYGCNGLVGARSVQECVLYMEYLSWRDPFLIDMCDMICLTQIGGQ